jgi:serine/threonine protein kinase
MNTMRELILSDGCEGFITNRTFTKKEKISNGRSNVLIYCSCGGYLHKNKKNRFVFGHTNECNKKLELKSVNFLFKIAEGLELNEEKIKKNVFYCPNEKNIIKVMRKSEYSIMKKLQDIKCFPKIEEMKIDGGEYNVIMDFYESKKITYNECDFFVKQYIKALLQSIKHMNDKGYIHGDIKPSNFLFYDSNEYHLIDFNSSIKISSKLNNRNRLGPFPYIAPETNYLFGCYNDIANEKSDLWSVGIILLSFLAKKEVEFEIDQNIKENRKKSLYQYKTLYENIEINCTEIDIKNCKYDKSFIKNDIERENKDANDLVENLLKLDLNERLNVEML